MEVWIAMAIGFLAGYLVYYISHITSPKEQKTPNRLDIPTRTAPAGPPSRDTFWITVVCENCGQGTLVNLPKGFVLPSILSSKSIRDADGHIVECGRCGHTVFMKKV